MSTVVARASPSIPYEYLYLYWYCDLLYCIYYGTVPVGSYKFLTNTKMKRINDRAQQYAGAMNAHVLADPSIPSLQAGGHQVSAAGHMQ